MNITFFLAFLGTAMAILGFVYGFLRNFKADINNNFDDRMTRFEKDFDGRITRLEKDFDGRITRLETDINNLANKVEAETKAQTSRTDRLYEMFIMLLERRKIDPRV
jgi:hypothetical protein